MKNILITTIALLHFSVFANDTDTALKAPVLPKLVTSEPAAPTAEEAAEIVERVIDESVSSPAEEATETEDYFQKHTFQLPGDHPLELAKFFSPENSPGRVLGISEIAIAGLMKKCQGPFNKSRASLIAFEGSVNMIGLDLKLPQSTENLTNYTLAGVYTFLSAFAVLEVKKGGTGAQDANILEKPCDVAAAIILAGLAIDRVAQTSQLSPVVKPIQKLYKKSVLKILKELEVID